MPREYSSAESVELKANELIPTSHAEIASARIRYIFVDKASMKSGRPVRGKVRKLSGAIQYLLEADFLIEVALDQWNNLQVNQRAALVDHLLEHCSGEEDEQSGDMKWIMREPDVKEFVTILRRHGAWDDSLYDFVELAHNIPIEERIREVVEAVAAEEVQVQN